MPTLAPGCSSLPFSLSLCFWQKRKDKTFDAEKTYCYRHFCGLRNKKLSEEWEIAWETSSRRHFVPCDCAADWIKTLTVVRFSLRLHYREWVCVCVCAVYACRMIWPLWNFGEKEKGVVDFGNENETNGGARPPPSHNGKIKTQLATCNYTWFEGPLKTMTSWSSWDVRNVQRPRPSKRRGNRMKNTRTTTTTSLDRPVHKWPHSTLTDNRRKNSRRNLCVYLSSFY